MILHESTCSELSEHWFCYCGDFGKGRGEPSCLAIAGMF
jgi:hypothetical protein